MPSTPLASEQILSMLAGAPPQLAALTGGLDPVQLRTPLGQDEWSANEVLAHMRACADVWGGCIAEMLANDRPTLRAINPRTWIKRTNYRDLEFQPSLHAYTTQRSALLAILEPLPPERWVRAAIVRGAGKVLERTVLSYAQWIAIHERPHLKQIARIVKKIRRS